MNTTSLLAEFEKKGVSQKDASLLGENAPSEVHLRRWLQRRLFSEPLEHIIGEASFCGSMFKVESGIYVPTKESESLVRYVVNEINTNSYSSIIDVGAGSGALGLSIKKQVPKVSLIGVDINPRAVIIAKDNARRWGIDSIFEESFYVTDINCNEPDIIVADLPYGNRKYLLDSNEEDGRKFAPLAFFHPLGILQAYVELIQSIKEKKWSSKTVIETGPLEEPIIHSELGPFVEHIEYTSVSNKYSVCALEGFK